MAGHAFPLTLPLDNSLNRRWWAGWQAGSVFSEEECFDGHVLVIELLSEDEMAVVSDFLGFLLRNPLREAAAPKDEAEDRPGVAVAYVPDPLPVRIRLAAEIGKAVGEALESGATYDEVAECLESCVARTRQAQDVGLDFLGIRAAAQRDGQESPPRHPATGIGE